MKKVKNKEIKTQVCNNESTLLTIVYKQLDNLIHRIFYIPSYPDATF